MMKTNLSAAHGPAASGRRRRRAGSLSPGAGARLQPPRGAFITTTPKVDATDFYMFNSYEPAARRLCDADRQLPAAAGRATAARTTSSWTRTRCTRSTSTTPATPRKTSPSSSASRTSCKRHDADDRRHRRRDPADAVGPSATPNAPTLNVNETYTLTSCAATAAAARAAGDQRRPAAATFDKPVDNIGEKTIPTTPPTRRSTSTRSTSPAARAGQGVRRPAPGPVRGQPRRHLRPGQRARRGRITPAEPRPDRQLEA